MASKTEKLIQNLQNIQLFLKSKTDRHSELNAIDRVLQKFADVIKTEKLTLQIVSQVTDTVQSVFDLLKTKPELLESCRIELNSLPTCLKDDRHQTIASLQSTKNIRNEDNLSKLLPGKKYLIGRGNDCDLKLDPQLNQGISWHHAVIRSRELNNLIQWQIEDCNSTNGTFVNGQKVLESYQLSSGDRITFGYAKSRQGIAELIFNLEELTLKKDTLYRSIIDCDLLLIGINLKPFLTLEEQKFLTSLNNCFSGKLCSIVDLSCQNLSALKNLENWLQQNTSNLQFELIPIELKSSYKNNDFVDVSLQKQRDNFHKIIENIIKRQGDNLIAQRFSNKLIQILEPVDLILRSQQTELELKIQRQQQKIEQINQVNLKEVTKKVTTQVNEDKDRFFKQVKQDLAQAKAALLDSYSKQSLIYKIQAKIEKSQPIISNHRGEKHVKLKAICNSNTEDINSFLIDFCISFLDKWTKTEWDKVCHVYGEGGLHGVLNRSSNYVKVISLIKTPSFVIPEIINIRHSLLNSFVENDSEVAYKETSLFDYILKQLRTNMMQIMMMFTLILPLLGIKVSKTTLLGHLSQVFVKLPWLFGIVVCLISYLLVNAYQQDNQSKLEGACQVLRKEANNYYQSFAKSLCDRAIQEINFGLEKEEKKIVKTLGEVEQVYAEYLLNTEKNLIQIKSVLEQDKLQQKNLEKEIAEFSNLKRI
jgi:pSer/pThr/pTyr-binding forkhead associated (FHA) protein